MNLIDRDAIPWSVDGIGEIPVVTKEEIDEMPVVEAEGIPVGFIIKTALRYEDQAELCKGNEKAFKEYSFAAYVLNTLMISYAKEKYR